MKRTLVLILAAILVLAALSACGTPTQKDETNASNVSSDAGQTKEQTAAEQPADQQKITLTAKGFYASPDLKKLMDDTIAEFKKTHPNVDIQFTGIQATVELAQVLKLAFDSGTGPDLVHVDDLMQRLLTKNGYMLDITQDVQERGWLDKTKKGAMDFYNMRTPGKYYSVPNLSSIMLLYYNKDILAKLNVQPPKTFTELNDIMYKAKEAGYIPLEVGGVQTYQLLWLENSMLLTSVPKDDYFKWYNLKETTPKFVESYKTILKQIDQWNKDGLFRKNVLSIDSTNVPTLYGEGKTAFTVSGMWDLGNIEKTKVNTGITTVPQVDSSLPYYVVSQPYGAWGLNAKISPEKKKAALDFIDLLISPDMAKKWFEGSSFVATGKFDASTAQISPLKLDAVKLAENVYVGGFMDNAVPGILPLMTKLNQQLLMKQITPDQFWEQLNAEYEKLKPQYTEGN